MNGNQAHDVILAGPKGFDESILGRNIVAAQEANLTGGLVFQDGFCARCAAANNKLVLRAARAQIAGALEVSVLIAKN